MNLAKLFEIQRELDQHIVEKKGLQGQDLLPKKILALQVELGELCNCWRGFKFWSEDQEPRRKSFRWVVVEEKENSSLEQEVEYYPLLEEYVDCLHFLLSIGLEIGEDDLANLTPNKESDLVFTFIECNEELSKFVRHYYDGGLEIDWKVAYIDLFEKFLGLGEQLGFTWEEIEESYFEKNRINHERQESGY
ncbi:dUTPase [Caldalkalibacillus thermarum TA2.A1]|uniref:dUTP diphosphatase n=1 Tax=Caldalkalibacillus thermarum (strain TA2.A1) TaxID=986075 RepID=F5L9D7_CALTT|nr:dUTP diphosphatase [Caldalkalibacillus thermarum]EGL82079.1 dUTPase [Caldalkalibacillus thermarum TA2.A1]QZT34006.1 dUTP diphosphatase [Caldalkalibacillus thermarum TA2.A1]